MRKNTSVSVNRRKVLATSVSGGLLSIGGCLGIGGDSNETSSYVLGTAGETTAVHGVNTAIATEVSNSSDILDISSRTTPGSSANPRLIDEGQIDIAGGSDMNAWECNQGIGPYSDDPPETTMCQSISSHTVELFLFKRDTEELQDIKTVEDIPEDTPMTWAAPGSSAYFIFQYGFELLGLENPVDNYNIVNMEYGGLADALREERVDITISATINGVNVASYTQEILGSVDMDVIDWGFTKDDVMNGNVPFSYSEVDAENFSAELSLDSIPAATIIYNTFFPENFNDDHVYEFCEKAFENSESIREYHAAAGQYGPEFAQERVIQDTNVPVHPGAETYYKDNSMWNDSWSTMDDYNDPR